jgi:uncharacterized membrane protein
MMFRKKTTSIFSEEEKKQIVTAVKKAEQNTSGEVRVFIESKCSFIDALDRASEVFFSLKMDQTEHRNGVLVYLAYRDRQVAVFGDEGIYEKLGASFWNNAVQYMLHTFQERHMADGIIHVVNEIGESLAKHFPYEANIDRNELPDEIVFGK